VQSIRQRQLAAYKRPVLELYGRAFVGVDISPHAKFTLGFTHALAGILES
jgi:hypothetical protein